MKTRPSPVVGDIWQCHRGKEYVILGIARDSRSNASTVVCMRLEDRKLYVYPLFDFRTRIEFNGRHKWRFEKVGQAKVEINIQLA
jgi:hypothetical protein